MYLDQCSKKLCFSFVLAMPCPVSPAELCVQNAQKGCVGGSLYSLVSSLPLAAVFVSLECLHSPLMTSSAPVLSSSFSYIHKYASNSSS